MGNPNTNSIESSPRKPWYGGYLIALDGVAIFLVVMPIFTMMEGMSAGAGGAGVGWMSLLGIVVSLFVYGVGTPLVHLFHRQLRPFLASIALRLALPCIVALVFYESPDGNHGALDGAVYLFAGLMGLGGALLAMGIDWVVLARRVKRTK